MRRIFIVLLALFARSANAECRAAASNPSIAVQRDLVVFQCITDGSVYRIENLYRETLAASGLPRGARDAIRICDDRQSYHHYFLRVPKLMPDHMCRFTEQEIFPVYGAATPNPSASALPQMTIASWTLTVPPGWQAKGYQPPIRSFALTANGRCPAADDLGYRAE